MQTAGFDDFRAIAARRLPRFLFDYIDGGALDEVTMARNVADLRGMELRQAVMRDVSQLALSTTLFGRPAAMPVALGPVGLAGLYARRGEVPAARAAGAAGLPFILSSTACCGIDEVTTGAGAAPLLQLYMIRDRGFMAELLARARALGVETLVLTVDLALNGVRRRDIRTSLAGEQGAAAQLRRAWQIACRPRWAWQVGVRGRPHTLGNFAAAMPAGAGLDQYQSWVAGNFDASITWADMDWIRRHWTGRLAVKGVLDPGDAVDACAAGAQDVVVSNHGGRQLDGAPSTIAALPAVVDAVAGRAEILIDSGIRSGTDILRALALGARGVLLGRAWAFALAAGGEAGVARMLSLMREELRVAMALAGQTDAAAIDPAVLLRSPRAG